MLDRFPAQSGPRPRTEARLVLLGGLLAVLVAAGVLAMHALHLGDSSQPPTTPAHAASAQVAPVAPAGGAAAEGPAGHSGAVHASGGAVVGQGMAGHGAAGMDCDGCPSDHAGLALSCLLALLLALVLLIPPGAAPWSLRRPVRRVLGAGRRWSAPPRPPSLTMLCISRT